MPNYAKRKTKIKNISTYLQTGVTTLKVSHGIYSNLISFGSTGALVIQPSSSLRSGGEESGGFSCVFWK